MVGSQLHYGQNLCRADGQSQTDPPSRFSKAYRFGAHPEGREGEGDLLPPRFLIEREEEEGEMHTAFLSFYP
jgi:hypothetical protein